MMRNEKRNAGILGAIIQIIGALLGEIFRALISAAVLGFGFHMFYDHYFSWNFNLPPLGIPCAFWGAFVLMYLVIILSTLFSNHNKD